MKKILCLSDPHGKLPEISKDLEFDIGILSGDVCPHHPNRSIGVGSFQDLIFQKNWLETTFLEWFERNFKSRNKKLVFIMGNHDFIGELNPVLPEPDKFLKSLSKDLIYLNCENVEVDSLKIWGSPFSPHFFDWAFNFPKHAEGYFRKAKPLYNSIPDDTNIVITHGPAKGIMDSVPRDISVGDEYLRYRLEQLPNLKLHVFGHLHSQYGVQKGKWISVGASVVNEKYELTNEPIVVEI